MPEPTPDQTTRRPAAATSAAGMKDTIESVLVALILAFIFRAFVVEAFVIPTGSMATTLLGAHVRFNCQDCGYRFNHAVETGQDMRVDRVARRSFTAFCPNCQFENELDGPAIYYGDRILVLKYLYLLQEPRRWDVVVFKSPHDPDYEVNYIKRLVGKPGEQVMILDGDIYVRGTDDEPWRVQAKPRHVQEALWRVVHDNDFQPQGLARPLPWRQPWQPAGGQGWSADADNSRIWRFDNPDGAGLLRFEPQPLPTRGQPLSDFTDRLAYNPAPGTHAVSDLKLQLFYHRLEGTGRLRLRLGKRGQTVIAEIGSDTATVLMQTGNDEPQPMSYPVALSGNGPLRIEFSNVDYQVTLRVNDSDLIRVSYEPDINRLIEEYEQGERAPLPRVEIEAERQRGYISHLSLWRDIYYINHILGAQPVIWGRPIDPIVLGEGEYFVLGDNSSNSLDARQWPNPVHLPHEDLWVQAGRVPERFMLGKAFFVYWPAGFRPLTPHMYGIIPNVGEMRFIH